MAFQSAFMSLLTKVLIWPCLASMKGLPDIFFLNIGSNFPTAWFISSRVTQMNISARVSCSFVSVRRFIANLTARRSLNSHGFSNNSRPGNSLRKFLSATVTTSYQFCSNIFVAPKCSLHPRQLLALAVPCGRVNPTLPYPALTCWAIICRPCWGWSLPVPSLSRTSVAKADLENGRLSQR
jgi:hypothetical protein